VKYIPWIVRLEEQENTTSVLSLSFQLLFKVGLHMVYKVWITTNKDKIIKIKNKNDKRLTHFIGADNILRITPRNASI